MTHNEMRLVWYKEGFYSLISGAIFGASSIVIGHPLDTVKTKMQAQVEYRDNPSVKSVICRIWKREGLVGFYRGAFPPLIGSIMFRSMQFSVFEAVYSYFENNKSMKQSIPYTFGLQYRVILGGIVASLLRSVVECPVEFAKVKRQTGQQWQISAVYKGYVPLLWRTTGMLTIALSVTDTLRRNTRFYESVWGLFLVGGLSGLFAWTVVWPIENIKNIIQAGLKTGTQKPLDVMRWIIAQHGFVGLYRGMLPGLLGIFLRNGFSMYCMQITNKTMTRLNVRK